MLTPEEIAARRRDIGRLEDLVARQRQACDAASTVEALRALVHTQASLLQVYRYACTECLTAAEEAWEVHEAYRFGLVDPPCNRRN